MRSWWFGRGRRRVALGCAVAPALVALVVACGADPVGAPPDARTEPHGVVVTPTGIVAPVLATDPSGWWVRTPCYQVAHVAEGRFVGQADVVLDPGHGGSEDGAENTQHIRERTVNLAVVELVRPQLERAGRTVVQTRTTDTFMTLHTRAEIATALAPQAFVSVHHNAGAYDPLPHPGTESYHQFSSADSVRLATHLQEDVFRAMDRYQVAWRGATDARVKERLGDHGDYYGILRHSTGVPAAIIEAAFISNPEEAALMATVPFRQDEADAIAGAIGRYLAEPRSGPLPPRPTPTADVTGTTSAAEARATVPATRPPPGEVPDDAAECVDPPLT